MSSPSLSKREVANMTGVDISVRSSREIEGPLGGISVEYYIDAVATHKAFKSEFYDSEDVVEFQTWKTYRECEVFYQKLLRTFSKLSLPTLPKSTSNINSSTETRQNVLNEFMVAVAKDADACGCSLLILFLGVDTSKAHTLPVIANPSTISELTPASNEETIFENSPKSVDIPDSTNRRKKSDGLFGEVKFDRYEDEEDLFKEGRGRNETGSKPLFDHQSLSERTEKIKKEEALTSMFEPQDYGGAVTANEEHLFLISGAKITKEPTELEDMKALVDTAELLSVDDDLDKLFDAMTKKKTAPASKPAPPAKPNLPPKPVPPPKPARASRSASQSQVPPQPSGENKPKPTPRPRKMTAPSSSSSDCQKPAVEEDIAEVDILKYIQAEEQNKDENLDLFS